MTIEAVAPVRKMVPRCFYAIRIDGKEIPIPADFEDMLEELNGTSPGMSHVVIYDTPLAKALEAAGLIERSVRGSYWATDRFRRNRETLQDAVSRSLYDSPVDCAEDAEALRAWDLKRQKKG